MKKFCPQLGQQVFVHYLETPLIPVIFAGWCVDKRSKGLKTTFTLADGASRRLFFLHSPEVLDVYINNQDINHTPTKSNFLSFSRDLNRNIALLKYKMQKIKQ